METQPKALSNVRFPSGSLLLGLNILEMNLTGKGSLDAIIADNKLLKSSSLICSNFSSLSSRWK